MEIKPFIVPIYDEVHEVVETDKVALIDADRYKHLVVNQVWKRMNEEGELHSEQLVNTVIDNYLYRDIFNQFKAKDIVFCFSAPSGKVFRNAIAQEKKYKGTRGKYEDKRYYAQKWDDMAYVYEFINARYHTLFYDDLEADDILSMAQNEKTFIFSHDKDLRQVPGTHWDIESRKFIETTEEAGLMSLCYQLLKGDSVDNIPGLKGFGEKALENFQNKILVENLSPAQAMQGVIEIYTNKLGLSKGYDTFVEMWSLLAMRQNRGDYNQEKYGEIYTTINGLTE